MGVARDPPNRYMLAYSRPIWNYRDEARHSRAVIAGRPTICAMKKTLQDLTNDLKARITINELLQVKIPDDPVSYFSRINDVVEGKLVIAWPTNAGIRLLVHRDQILDFSFVREATAYSFTGLVDEISPEPLPQITVILSTAIMRVQRRQNYRIKCLIPVELVGAIQEDPREDTTSPLVIKTTTYDLSASGISIRYPLRIPEGTLLEIKLSLPDNGPLIKVPCKVMHSESISENAKQCRTGIHYLAISERERARIVRYVYRMQLKGLRS
jgi:c-di-GMP-binding flagellar brake protein YcgR